MNVLVTGARRGLGHAFATRLASEGHTVVGTVRSRAPSLDGTGVHTVSVDLGEPDGFPAAVQAIAGHCATLDLVIHNAGINSRSLPKGCKNVRWGDLEPTGILEAARINAVAPVLLTQALMPLLGEGSRVVCISSWLGSIGTRTSGGNYAYTASKAMLNTLARSMAFDLATRGIVTVLMNPGWVRTDMGGERADLSPEQSVEGMLSVIEGLTEADAGRFLQWDGAEVAW